MTESPPATTADPAVDDGKGLGLRALRTRQAILDTSKELFLERGYLGTSVNAITTACGISRAGFYTYFRDKREIFNTLGEATYRELLELVGRWDDMARPCRDEDVAGWVREYFAFMDRHGAFILSAQSAPPAEDVRLASNRMQMRVAWVLGVHLRGRQAHPTDAPEALGLVTQSMLDRSWHHTRDGNLPVATDDVVATIVAFIIGALTA
jgi:AcrR family transcriptional regulator